MPNSCSAIVDRIVKRVSSRCDLNTVKSPLCNNTDNGGLSTQQENDCFSKDNPHFQGLTNCSYAATAHIASRARTLRAYDCRRALARGPEWVGRSQREPVWVRERKPEWARGTRGELEWDWQYRDRAIVESEKARVSQREPEWASNQNRLKILPITLSFMFLPT